MEFIFFPFLWIGKYVLPDALIFARIADDVIVITWLPYEWDVVLPGKFRYANFIPAHDGCQVLRLRPKPYRRNILRLYGCNILRLYIIGFVDGQNPMHMIRHDNRSA